MAIPILPTSFFGNPDPQGSINGNIARLAVEAGDALTKRVEQNAIQNEAALKAPAIGRIYGDAFQRLATGDTSGLAGLAQANAIAGGNPILTQMNSDAFHLGTSVLNDANTRTMLQTRLDAENNMLGRRLSAEAGLDASRNATRERIASETIQGRNTAISEAGWQKQTEETQKERQKLQDKYQQDHDAWKALNDAGKDAGPEPQMPLLPELPARPTVASGPTLPQGGGIDNSPLFDTNGTQVARATAVSTTPGTVKQPDGTIATEPSLPTISPAPSAPVAATPRSAGTPIAISNTTPDGVKQTFLNIDTLKSSKVKEALSQIGVSGNGIQMAPQSDGSVAFTDASGNEGSMSKADFDKAFSDFTSGAAAKTGGLREIKFGSGTLLVPLVDEKKDASGKETISAKIGNVTRTYSEGSTNTTQEGNTEIEREKGRLRKLDFGEVVDQFNNTDPDIATFWSKFLPPNGKGVDVVPVSPSEKSKLKEPQKYNLIGKSKDGEIVPYAPPGMDAKDVWLTPQQAAAVGVIKEKYRADKYRYVPGPEDKKPIEPPKFDSPVAQQAFDDLKQRAKSEGWSAERFVTESQKIDKSGKGILDLPKGMKRTEDIVDKANNDEEIKNTRTDIEYETRKIDEMEKRLEEFKKSGKSVNLMPYNIPAALNDSKEKLSKLRQKIRSLGGNPD